MIKIVAVKMFIIFLKIISESTMYLGYVLIPKNYVTRRGILLKTI